MKPFKKILVPVDFSLDAREAIHYAADLSKRYEAKTLLLHVFQPVSYALPDGYILYSAKLLSAMMAEFQKQLDAAKEEAKKAGAVSVGTALLEGVAFEEILNFSEKGDYDLIVMGTHGRTGIRRALLGSVAEHVVREAACPVLTVHPKKRTKAKR